ncbi:MAG: hypothetical protein J0L70_29950 [Leptolyngbya sp. UWPOB_LEPTO1]|uniref:hypothetical protein n=1 Tax=Leptolyngbya sp. UWPOB_LEPTO1 TaxID=2815653 RepID=UPI001AC9BE15|nr:hypothetical protein [Leptolyngbya sp. UWPOB_LEPTO1]MBN8564760.1 hypothetical protein [Leptolyngbya sp. UWPOB_LEPTO1]
MNPKNYSITTLIGKCCPIDRENCLLTPSRWYESQHPENFELKLLAWEEKGKELLDL